jgi:predicted protein tyrosine phosphatase
MSKEARPRRILFVCTANVHRSRTAHDLYRGNRRYEVRSAGTDVYNDDPDEEPVTDELLAWADIVFVMEPYHRDAIEERFHARPGKIVVLDIEDRYDRGEPQLIRLLEERLSRYL